MDIYLGIQSNADSNGYLHCCLCAKSDSMMLIAWYMFLNLRQTHLAYVSAVPLITRPSVAAWDQGPFLALSLEP